MDRAFIERMRWFVFRVWLVVVAWAVRADGWAPDAVGLRCAISATSMDDLYGEVEPVVRWRVPLDVELGADWEVQFWGDASVGWLAARGDHGVIGTVGPLLSLGRRGWRVRFEGGLSVSVMDRYKYGADDFGSYVQFISHAGGAVELSRHWSVGYRWQHMSNAGLAQPNPGLNLHALTFLYRF